MSLLEPAELFPDPQPLQRCDDMVSGSLQGISHVIVVAYASQEDERVTRRVGMRL